MFPAPEPSSGCGNRGRARLGKGVRPDAGKAGSGGVKAGDREDRRRSVEQAQRRREAQRGSDGAEQAAISVTAGGSGGLVVGLADALVGADPVIGQGVCAREQERPGDEHQGKDDRGGAGPEPGHAKKDTMDGREANDGRPALERAGRRIPACGQTGSFRITDRASRRSAPPDPWRPARRRTRRARPRRGS